MAQRTKIIWRGKQMTRRVEVGLALAMESFAVNIWSSARKGCPVDTGSLRNSIRVERLKGLRGRAYVVYRIVAGSGSDVSNSGMRSVGGASRGVGVGIQKGIGGKKWRNPFYALYVELGTSRMAARPFMRNAFNRHLRSFKGVVRKYMRPRLN